MKSWYGYSLMTVFVWGFWGLFSKLAVGSSKPRHVLIFQAAGILVVAILALCLMRFSMVWSARGFAFSFLAGLAAFLGYFTLFLALERGKASAVVTLSALSPLVTVVLSVVFLHERLTRPQALGVILAVIAGALLAM